MIYGIVIPYPSTLSPKDQFPLLRDELVALIPPGPTPGSLHITMPDCRSRLDIPSLDEFPLEDVPCTCGNPEHWFIKWRPVESPGTVILQEIQQAASEGNNNVKCEYLMHGKEVGLMHYVQEAFRTAPEGSGTNPHANCIRAMYLGVYIDTAERLCKA